MISYKEIMDQLDRHVLGHLSVGTDKDWSVPAKLIASQDISIDMVRTILRSLRARGFVKHHRYIYTDEGHLMGSGHTITKEGRKHHEKWEPNDNI